MQGKVLGHYRILEQIGAGGMGVVYRARDERLQREVAVKVLPSGTLADEAARRRFRAEALALSALNHPNIATVHDFDCQEGTDFLVTEFIPGETLDARLAGGPLPEKDVMQLGAQLAEGLAAAHAQGIVHRDLKPGNLRVTSDGRLKILDFGLARLQPAAEAETRSRPETKTVAGTVPYMSPEQLRGEEVDGRSDIWSAGAVLYELACGRLPFTGKTATSMAGDILHTPPPAPRQLRPEVSQRLEDIILKCLEKDPENRYQSAKELLVDLRRLASGSTAGYVPPPVAARRKWLWWAAGAVVLLAAVLATGYLVFRREPGPLHRRASVHQRHRRRRQGVPGRRHNRGAD